MIKHNYTQQQLKAIEVCSMIAGLLINKEIDKQVKDFIIKDGIHLLITLKPYLSDEFMTRIDFDGCLHCLDK